MMALLFMQRRLGGAEPCAQQCRPERSEGSASLGVRCQILRCAQDDTSWLPCRRWVCLALVFIVLALCAQPAHAYIEAPYALGRVITESTNILILRVEKVDHQKNLIIYRKVKDLKGTHPGETIKHTIG